MRSYAMVVLALSFLVPGVAQAAFTYPAKPQGLVSDFARSLKPADKTALNAKLSDLRARTGKTVAVAIFRDLGRKNIAVVGPELFRRWYSDPKTGGNTVLLVISLRGKVLRIEVGRGLEKTIPPGLAQQIVRDNLVPPLRQGHVDSAIASYAERVENIFAAEARDRIAAQPAAKPQADERSVTQLVQKLSASIEGVVGAGRAWMVYLGVGALVVLLAVWFVFGGRGRTKHW